MIPEGLDHSTITLLTSQQVEYVTCIECCKYYIVPETAECGHTLCHGCWTGRRTCPVCAAPVSKSHLKINLPLQTQTEHIHTLGDAFEKLFNIKLAEKILEIEGENDTSNNVKDWLANSQNNFSAPLLQSQLSVPNQLELSASKIQIHSHKKDIKSSTEVKPDSKITTIKITPVQDDWDKIETLPDSEDINPKRKQNILSPIALNHFNINDEEYSTNNPRRSSRKRDKHDLTTLIEEHDVVEKHSSANSSADVDKKSVQSKQNWNNVKKMRKEFSKLNQKKKNKLNVSIEMCKKAQSISKPAKAVETVMETDQPYTIDDNTPDLIGKESKILRDKNSNEKSFTAAKETSKTSPGTDIEINMTNNKQRLSNTKLNESGKEKPTKNFNITGNGVTTKTTSINSNNESGVTNNDELNKQSVNLNTIEENNIRIIQKEVDSNAVSVNTDDIEISIKIGNTVTNIFIKKKEKDVQLKVNTDQEVQACLGPFTLPTKKDAACSPVTKNLSLNCSVMKASVTTPIVQSKSTKKNTESADTATAKFEITESVEKELSDLMECAETDPAKINTDVPKNIQQNQLDITNESKKPSVANENFELEDIENLNDVDIFGSGSVKEGNVHLLKHSKYAPSEILIPTMKGKKSQKSNDKRDREYDEVVMPCNKKQKIDLDVIEETEPSNQEVHTKPSVGNDSEHISYDVLMSQVFANIDADLSQKKTGKTIEIKKQTQILKKKTEVPNEENPNDNIAINVQKDSENIFSALDKDSEPVEIIKVNNQNPGSETQNNIQNLLTPGMCRDLASSIREQDEINDVEMLDIHMGTPIVDPDDSDDKSIVEETPQKLVKNVSFSKPKPKSGNLQSNNEIKGTQTQNDSQIIKSIINISDTEETTKLTTILSDTNKKSLETPITINKFVNHIQHKSTPMARKSLNFDKDDEDLEETLCPTVQKDNEPDSTTTQEKEILAKAFEKTQVSPINAMVTQGNRRENRKLHLAGSCLTPAELANVKALCAQHGWLFLDKFSNDLTHLVVGVDEEMKSQRSVKYMCALAASKWIVSYTWVEQCLATKTIAQEHPHEAMDAGGDPGPRLSRTAKTKLFQGFSFYCMSPFSILDVDSLKFMLEAAGGRVVSEAKSVKVLPGAPPALLIAEPEHMQEDRFTYMAMELCIVPVNFEWVLNCLGSYTLHSFYDLLLCPTMLLPPATNMWPEELLSRDKDDEDLTA